MSGRIAFRLIDALALGLCAMGTISVSRGQTPAAEASQYQGELRRATKARDQKGQIAALQSLGAFYRSTGETQRALELLNRALTIERDFHDERAEAETLTTIGGIDNDTGHPQDALKVLNGTLQTERRLADHKGEAAALTAIGEVYWSTGDSKHALELHNQALAIEEQVNDSRDQGITLSDIGVCYWSTGEPGKAIEYFNQAISNERKAEDRSDEAVTLHSIGVALEMVDRLREALDYFKQALPLEEETANRRAEAGTLQEIGSVYESLGLPQEALSYFNRAIALERKVGDRDTEASALNAIGAAYNDVGQPRQALKAYKKALEIEQAVGSLRAEAVTLNNVGVIYQETGKLDKALPRFQQSLELDEQTDNLNSAALTTWHIASLEGPDAVREYGRAVSLAQQVGDLSLQGQINHSLMIHFRKQMQLQTATFFGKEAVNAFQGIRANLQGLNTELQRSYLNSKEQVYRDLANLLIDQGRLPEAQQVLDLLKQQEYSDYVRSDKANTLSPLALTPAEQQAEEDYAKSAGTIVALGEQWSALKKIATRTPEQEQQFQQLSGQLDAASKGLNDYYSRLYTLFGGTSSANKQVVDVKGDVSLLKQTIAHMPHTVALYTLVGSERYSVIVITGSTAVARELPISEKDLNEKVAAFQRSLRDPHSDARPLAQDLYNILIAPVKADLDQAQAQTLVWSLDGVLRYVPISALFDGKQYVVENYATVTITPASVPHLGDRPDFGNMTAAAMGISRKYEEGLSALPAVAGELDKIVKDAQFKGAQGVLPGTILLDGAFTEKAMENLLDTPHTVVHIASHFVFRPGDDSQSFLLLAGKDADTSGYHLSVADFRDDQRLSLDDTDLLTLSACETGMTGSAANGREVDGLGTTAQLKGAKAVISSLWEVNDASTGELMADFYKRWSAGEGKVAKVEALRQAQLDLLRGNATLQSGSGGRGFSAVDAANSSAHRPASYAHPYYWAPFVLMGNWR